MEVFKSSFLYKAATMASKAHVHSMTHRIATGFGKCYNTSRIHRFFYHFRMKPTATENSVLLLGITGCFHRIGRRKEIFSGFLRYSLSYRIFSGIWLFSRQRPILAFLSGVSMLLLGLNVALLLTGSSRFLYLIMLAGIATGLLFFLFFEKHIPFSLTYRLVTNLYPEDGE
ncbi:MAG: hypothetical protein R6W96_06230 [Clostridia bacterium]